MEDTSTVGQLVHTAAEKFGAGCSSFTAWAQSRLTWSFLFKFFGTILLLFSIWLVYKLAKKGIKRIPHEKLPEHQATLLLKVIRYASFVICIMYMLSLFGIELSAVLGAAGIAGVAISFAAQTSMSNIISGIFVLGEHVVKIGDIITVDDVTGVVDSIDSMSVKVHTFDNQLVRIPNSAIIDSKLINLTYFPVRRYTFTVSIDFNTDMQKALDALLKAPQYCPTVVAEPAPAAWFDSFGASGINMILAVWMKPEDFRQTKNDGFIAIKKVFDEAGISIPFNRVEVEFTGDSSILNHP